jgi:hypothetical protein
MMTARITLSGSCQAKPLSHRSFNEAAMRRGIPEVSKNLLGELRDRNSDALETA